MPEETLFSQIATGEEPSDTVYEDETTYAFLDSNPAAPGHTLVIPREPDETDGITFTPGKREAED